MFWTRKVFRVKLSPTPSYLFLLRQVLKLVAFVSDFSRVLCNQYIFVVNTQVEIDVLDEKSILCKAFPNALLSFPLETSSKVVAFVVPAQEALTSNWILIRIITLISSHQTFLPRIILSLWMRLGGYWRCIPLQ